MAHGALRELYAVRTRLLRSGIVILAVLVVLAVILFSSPKLFFTLYGYYHDLASGSEEIRTGSAYGVTIGQTKREAMHDMMAFHAGTRVYLGICKYRQKWRCAKLSQMDGYDDFIEKDIWHFSLIYGCCDSVKLYFDNGKLIEIRRIWSPGSIP